MKVKDNTLVQFSAPLCGKEYHKVIENSNHHSTITVPMYDPTAHSVIYKSWITSCVHDTSVFTKIAAEV